MATINAGWLTDFKDIKFAPKTVFSQVYVDIPEDGLATNLNTYFTNFLQKLDDRILQVDLASNSSVTFSNPGAIGVTGILGVPNGGTGHNELTQHALLIGNNESPVTLLPSTAGFLVSKTDGTAPLYSGIVGIWESIEASTQGPSLYIGFNSEDKRYHIGEVPLASTQFAGAVSIGAQTFGGEKTFAETAAFSKDVEISGALRVVKGANIADGLVIASGYVSGILTPTTNGQAANKEYVDAVQSNLNDLSNNIIGGTDSSGNTHNTRLSDLEIRMTDAENEFATLTTYLGGYADEDTKAFFILDKNEKAIAYFDENGLTVTEVILNGSENDYQNISLSSYFKRVDSLETHQATIYTILGETSLNTTKGSHTVRLNDHDADIADIQGKKLLVQLDKETSVTISAVDDNIGVNGELPVKHGGTGLKTLSQYDLMYGDGTNTVKFIAHDTTDTNGVKFLVNNPSAAPSYKTLGINYTAGTTAGSVYNIQIDGKDTGANFSLPVATVGQSGVVTTGEQTFSGKKIFSGKVAINGSTTIAAKLTAQSGIDVNSQNIENVAGMTYSDAERFYFVDNNDNTVAYVDSTGVNAINFISQNSDGVIVYNMNDEFDALHSKINTNLADIQGSTLYVNLSTQSTSTKFSDKALGVTGVLAVPNGGTGSSSAAVAGGIIYGKTTSAYGCTAAGSTGQFLMSKSTGAPVWVTPSVTLTGDITGSGQFDSSGAVSFNTTISDSGVSAGSYGPSASATLTNGGSFSVPYVTVDADGRLSAASTITYTLPTVSTTDNKVLQTVRTTNGNFPILLRGTSAGTTTTTTSTSFASAVTVNPSTGTIGATYMNAWALELFPASTADHGGYIDFHYNGSTEDYTSRIIELTSGTLTMTGNMAITGQTNFNNKIILNETSYGTELPSSGTEGQVFFLLIE